MIPWFYVWSPKYELFHHNLYGQIKDLSGFDVYPVFIPQSVFERKEGADGKHFLTGIGIKIYVLLKNLELRPNQHLLLSDVDILCRTRSLSEMLEPYLTNDITAMRERLDNQDSNIGFLLVKSTADTIAFFTRVLKRIQQENKLDQDAFMEELPSFPGTVGHFSLPSFLQSNMMAHFPYQEHEFAIVQCLSSEMNPETMLLQKIVTLTTFFDITPLRPCIPESLEKLLFEYLEKEDPTNYILQWPPRSSTNELA